MRIQRGDHGSGHPPPPPGKSQKYRGGGWGGNNASLNAQFVVKKINSLIFVGMKLCNLYYLCNTLGRDNTFEIAVYYYWSKMSIKDLIADNYLFEVIISGILRGHIKLFLKVPLRKVCL